MANEVMTTPSPAAGGFYDDGFSSGINSGSGNYLRWNAENQWRDRDGCEAPSLLLVIKVDELLRMWKDGRRTDITTHPLPNPDELNEAIPESEWEKDKDGKPRRPWAHHIAVCFVQPDTMKTYVYCAATTGAHIAFEELRASVAMVRMLRNPEAVPLVKLSSRPMKTRYKMSARPDFEIISWHVLGGGGSALAPPIAPQLPGPAAAERPPERTEPPQQKPSERRDEAISSGLQLQSEAQPQPQKQENYSSRPKPPVSATLQVMGEVKPPTSAEILNDDILW